MMISVLMCDQGSECNKLVDLIVSVDGFTHCKLMYVCPGVASSCRSSKYRQTTVILHADELNCDPYLQWIESRSSLRGLFPVIFRLERLEGFSGHQVAHSCPIVFGLLAILLDIGMELPNSFYQLTSE